MKLPKILAIQLSLLFVIFWIFIPRASGQNQVQAGNETKLKSQTDRVTRPVDSSEVVTLYGHVPRNATPQYDQGRVEPSFQLDHVTLLTLPSPNQKKALDQLLVEQQDPSSVNYHKWLTPEQYADRFGLNENDVQKISGWLTSQGLTVVKVARGRNWIVFAGTASQIENAFRTEIHRYNVNGEMHFANATPPSVPAGLSGIVTGIRGLDDFRPKPRSIRKSPQAQNVRPNYFDGNLGSGDFVAPGDIATIYDLKPLYAAGIDGTGQKLVVVGQTDVYLADLNDFRSGFGLSPINGCTTNSSGVITACDTSNFQYVLDGTDQGVSTQGDLTEADLDLEWSAATARGAQIIFVNSDNVFTSFYYAIDHKLAPVISMSYGACEFNDNNLPNDEVELTKANSFGITFVNSSGDSGAAECDPPPPFDPPDINNIATGGLAVSYPASSPEVTGVGGTATPFSDFTSTFWRTTNGSDGGTAISYIPEITWNDDVELVNVLGGTPSSIQEGSNPNVGISSSGGGASNCSVQTPDNSSCVSGFPQPSWQTVTISGEASARFSPDVSLMASPNFPGYIYCTELSELSGDSGTGSSCAPGGAAGITSALALSPIPSIVGGTSVSAPIFAGIVTILNQALSSSGQGNINPILYTLAATPSNNVFHHITSGTNVVFCEAGTPSSMPASYRCPSTGSFGFNASNADTTTGYNLVTGLGSVDVANLANALGGNTTGPNFSLAFSPATVTVSSPGGSATTEITITGTNGYNGTVTFSASDCSGLPAETTCSFSPSSLTGSGTVMLTVSTTAASIMVPNAPKTPASWTTQIRAIEFCAMGLGILWLGIQAKRQRWSTAVSLLVVCCFAFAFAGCGGSSGGGGGTPNPGTPVTQNQSVTVTVTAGSITRTNTFLLNVN